MPTSTHNDNYYKLTKLVDIYYDYIKALIIFLSRTQDQSERDELNEYILKLIDKMSKL